MRTLIAMGALFLCSGCVEDRAPRCGQAYDHLVVLAKGHSMSRQRARFIDSCGAAGAEEHLRCLLAADTVEEALACKRRKARPG